MAVHIQIDDTAPRVYYAVGATPQTEFVVPFAFFDDDNLQVYVDGVLKSLTTHYTFHAAVSLIPSLPVTPLF